MPWQAYPVTAMQANAYLFWQDDGKAVIVDPGEAVPRLLRDADGKDVRFILLTHSHLDHAAAVPEVQERTGASVVAPRAERDWLTSHGNDGSWNGLFIPSVFKRADRLVAGGDRIDFAGEEIRVLPVPGHSPGHVCYYLAQAGVVFSGDTLMDGTLGRWDLPGGSMDQLLMAIETQLLVLPATTQILPGHGSPTTIAAERRFNPWLQSSPP